MIAGNKVSQTRSKSTFVPLLPLEEEHNSQLSLFISISCDILFVRGRKEQTPESPKVMNKKKVHETRGHEGQMREKIISDTFIIMYRPSLAF